MVAIAAAETFLPKSLLEPTERRWTREEYYRLADQGFFEGQRVELIQGRILQMPPQGLPHTLAVERVDQFVRRAFPLSHRYRIQMPFRAADGSDPEPDVAVVPGSLDDAIDTHPSWAALLVEVSDTSLKLDRAKAVLYALSGVTDYWIVNLVDETIEVHRDPLPGNFGNSPPYGSVRIFRRVETIFPLAAPDASTQVSKLIP